MTDIGENMLHARSSSSFVTRFRLWLWDEDSAWSRNWLVNLVGKWPIRVPAGLSFAKFKGIYTLDGKREQSQLRRWPAAFGTQLLPTDVLQKLTRGLWAPNALRVFISRKRDIAYCIVVNDGARPMAVARRTIVRRTQEAFHHHLVVVRECQRRRVGSRLLRNAIELYRDLDIGAVRLTAGLSSGGMVWPKFGFRPVSQGEWEGMHGEIRKNMHQLDEKFRKAFEDKMGETIDLYIERLLTTGGPMSIWGLSDLDETWRFVSNSEHGLGSFLLQDIRWRGILDLKNGRALERLTNRLERAQR
jgi:GNAT superfamily N-acetyltransferase